jgi:hypothetical protein
MTQPIKDGFEASGFEPHVRTLKYFEDDYGLRVDDANEGNVEDEEEDEEENEDADYELVSGEDEEGDD